MLEPPPSRRAAWTRALRYLAAAFAVAVFARVLRSADLPGAAALIGRIGPAGAVVLLPFALGAVVHTLAWGRLFPRRPPGPGASSRGRAGFGTLLSVTLSTEALVMSLPGGALISESVSVYLLKRRAGVPLPESIASQSARKCLIVLTNGLYVMAAVAAGGGALRLASRRLWGGPELEWAVLVVGVGLLGAGIATWSALVHGSLAARLHRLLGALPIERLRRPLASGEGSFADADRHVSSALSAEPGSVALATALCLAGWAAEATETFLILRLLGAHLAFSEVLGLEVVASLLRSLAFFAPAGVGVQDAGYLALFGAVGIPDASAVGLAFVLIKRAKEVVWIAVGYGLLLLFRGTDAAGPGADGGPSPRAAVNAPPVDLGPLPST